MAKYIKTLHTIDLNHKPSVMQFLSFMHSNRAKITMYKGGDSISSALAIVTTHRDKEGK